MDIITCIIPLQAVEPKTFNLCEKNISNKSTAIGKTYTRQIFKEAMILTFD
jgi:hypothetical protein